MLEDCNWALQEFLDRRKMTEFGSLALVDDGDGDSIHISLPGVRRGTQGWVARVTCFHQNHDTGVASAQVT